MTTAFISIGLGIAGLALIVFIAYRWGVAKAKGKYYEKAVERAKDAIEIRDDTRRMSDTELRDRLRDGLD